MQSVEDAGTAAVAGAASDGGFGAPVVVKANKGLSL
jgi:hypothetical protein